MTPKPMQKMRVSERLRRQAERDVEAERQRRSADEIRRAAYAAGQQSAAPTMQALPNAFVEAVLGRAAEEFGRDLAIRIVDEVPGVVTMTVAREVWRMLERGEIRALGRDVAPYVEYRLDDDSLRLDVTIPSRRWSYQMPHSEAEIMFGVGPRR